MIQIASQLASVLSSLLEYVRATMSVTRATDGVTIDPLLAPIVLLHYLNCYH